MADYPWYALADREGKESHESKEILLNEQRTRIPY